MRRLTSWFAAKPACRDFAREQAGGIVPFAAAAVPVVAILMVGASEIVMVTADKSKLQDVADAVAMDAAQELAFTVNEGVVERAKVTAAEHLAAMKDKRPQGTIEVVPTIQFNDKGDPEGMHVAITSTRQSFFGNMLPPGGFVTKVETTALRMGKAPMCVLAFGGSTHSNTLVSNNSARLSAGKCLVHSNHEMVGGSTNPIETAAAEAVTRASGNISPTALVGAEPIADPFATMSLWPTLVTCNGVKSESYYDAGVTYLEPGVHCSRIAAGKNATLVLKPGEHYFAKGGLTVRDQAIVKAQDAVLIFDKDSTIDFSGASLIDFSGRKTGQFAGFVMIATRDNANDFKISAGNVVNLHGTVYVPGAELHVIGVGKVAEQSAWTVVVARELQLYGSANLVINANYRGSPVPVPKGVGNKAKDKTKNARLKR